jgi:neutral ceramidase
MSTFIKLSFFVGLFSFYSCGRFHGNRLQNNTHSSGNFMAGVAKRDMTGPALGLGTLGYAVPTPVVQGIKQRLQARAFVIKEASSEKRVAIVVLDTGFISWGIKHLVLNKLSQVAEGQFDDGNVVLTATHTHSAPGGFSNNSYYNIPFNGISKQNIDIMVGAVTNAIIAANQNLEPAELKYEKHTLVGANINRSLFAYLNNPADERSQYGSDTDVDTEQLTITARSGKPLGLINWFAVHGTSIEKDNLLINGDNKGYASYVMEAEYQSKGVDFVAAFPSKASGDASPNIARDVDGDGDWDCPTNENFACAQMIGDLQADAARRLQTGSGMQIVGGIDSRVSFIEMEAQVIAREISRGEGQYANGEARTCASAAGFAMVAGSEEDGPGIGKEGQTCSQATGIQRLRCKINMCHGEKSVAIPTGSMSPKWIEDRLPVQVMRIGDLVIAAGPGEFTTMSGRRIQKSVQAIAEKHGVRSTVFMSYANDFAGYTTTREEYQLQHYEGGHTLFGEWQLAVYQEGFKRIANNLFEGQVSESAGPPTINYDRFEASPVPSGDDVAEESAFGSIVTQPVDRIAGGGEVSVEFVSSNPNHDLMLNQSFFEVEMFDGVRWQGVRNDHDWDTSIRWKATSGKPTMANIQWKTSESTMVGLYRMTFRGVAKVAGQLVPYSGVSKEFLVE